MSDAGPRYCRSSASLRGQRIVRRRGRRWQKASETHGSATESDWYDINKNAFSEFDCDARAFKTE
eukprot:8147021-Lingulodinium_polyedra.AAC.1